jgi:hypothetical protein
MPRVLQTIVALACLFLVAAGPAETDYQIKLARPVKVGDRFRVLASGSESTTVAGQLEPMRSRWMA